MSVAISFESHNGCVDAYVLGSPGLRATGKNRFEAESALRTKLEDRIRMGDVKFIDLPFRYMAVSDFAGSYTGLDAELLTEITEQAYRERDAEKAAEFPE